MGGALARVPSLCVRPCVQLLWSAHCDWWTIADQQIALHCLADWKFNVGLLMEVCLNIRQRALVQ